MPSAFPPPADKSIKGPKSSGPAPSREIRALWGPVVLGGCAQSLAGATGALLARAITGGDAAAGLPQGMLVIGSAVAAGVLAFVSARTGRRASLALGCLVAGSGAIAVALGAATLSLLVVLLGSVLVGFGSAAVSLARYAAAESVPDGDRGRAMASILVATTIGAVAGPNLLALTDSLGAELSARTMVGPNLVAAGIFAAAAIWVALAGPRPISPRASIPRAMLDRNTSKAPGIAGSGVAGLIVLSTANLVMVAVMTMAPVHLAHLEVGLAQIGLVISLHIAAMFAPAPLSGWLSDRLGPGTVAVISAVVMVVACTTASQAVSGEGMALSMMLLGLGWNLALVSGSVLLIADVPRSFRPAREAWGEVGMGVAAAGGGIGSGVVMAGPGYGMLCVVGGSVAVLIALAGGTSLRGVRT